jgi:hypothetical protein
MAIEIGVFTLFAFSGIPNTILLSSDTPFAVIDLHLDLDIFGI